LCNAQRRTRPATSRAVPDKKGEKRAQSAALTVKRLSIPDRAGLTARDAGEVDSTEDIFNTSIRHTTACNYIYSNTDQKIRSRSLKENYDSAKKWLKQAKKYMVKITQEEADEEKLYHELEKRRAKKFVGKKFKAKFKCPETGEFRTIGKYEKIQKDQAMPRE
jgi:hypothetical protein